MTRVWTRSVVLAALLLMLATPGCGGRNDPPPRVGTDDAARTGAPADWPTVLVVLGSGEPALFLGPEPSSPPIGYISEGTRVRIDGPPRDGRVPVTVAGGLSARGWVPLSRLGLYATQRGRIPGTPTFVDAGDLVAVRNVSRESFEVEVRPWLGRDENDRLGPWTATLSREWLADVAPTIAAGLDPGSSRRVPAGRALPVYDRPGGTVVATIPATDPPQTVSVLREQGGWAGVRAGVGPYVVGYVEGPLEEASEPPRALYRPATAEPGTPPVRVAEETGTLHHVAAGTRVYFLDRTIARVRERGWARELSRLPDGRVDVYVAVDDAAAVRGLVDADALTPVQSSTP